MQPDLFPEYRIRKCKLHKSSYSAGFTVAELLVILAIIGVLASIILSSLNLARDKARATNILRNFQEIEKAMYLFVYTEGIYEWWTESPTVFVADSSTPVPGYEHFVSYDDSRISIEDMIDAGTGFELFLSKAAVTVSGGTGVEYGYYNFGHDHVNCTPTCPGPPGPTGGAFYNQGVGVRLNGYGPEDRVYNLLELAVDGVIDPLAGRIRYGGGSGSLYYVIADDSHDKI